MLEKDVDDIRDSRMLQRMTSTLRAFSLFACSMCGAKSTRRRCFRVSAKNEADARAEVSSKVTAWAVGLVGKNYRICQSIIDSFKQ